MTQAERKPDASARAGALTRPIHGVWSPTLVPVHEDFSIDVERFIAHARWLLAQGCHGLALFGTTSEANSFSLQERMALLEAALAAGIDPDRLMVGTGCCALTDSERLTRHAVDNGCKMVLMLPPFYYKGVSDRGLYRSYAQVIDRVGDDELRVLFYHFPRLSGVPITVGLIELLLADYPSVIAGLKDSSGDWSNTADLIERFPEMCIFPGSERYLLDGLRHGGAGCITATANVNPSGARGVWDAWASGSNDLEARNDRMIQVRTAIEAYPPIPAQKFLIARHRNDPAWRRVRPPLLDLDDRQGAELLESLAKLDFTLD
ncbi:MAG: dihydrodipicolinate synthase family protein [Gammaproteobacteria bacterium]|nr:dihydrodipicolinate synthase family protein [Gammaproteobacteria bacterium]NIM74163.1 dihydrodipicolinate synthase family protein [Gammaproteobacteria bacterium]NIN39074.1 dihydrodipicolinate synthase family protein [Gammaproteobacteria bacterium]NIO25940.1 dihydrodipicolinate synthase family protein [Gammaproteobacteria bacterium]NIO66570.1 dihydrodipicolinate synthase family protein [Gammaproteobacteria bacterium]